jgi:hypothetical protein
VGPTGPAGTSAPSNTVSDFTSQTNHVGQTIRADGSVFYSNSYSNGIGPAGTGEYMQIPNPGYYKVSFGIYPSSVTGTPSAEFLLNGQTLTSDIRNNTKVTTSGSTADFIIQTTQPNSNFQTVIRGGTVTLPDGVNNAYLTITKIG